LAASSPHGEDDALVRATSFYCCLTEYAVIIALACTSGRDGRLIQFSERLPHAVAKRRTPGTGRGQLRAPPRCGGQRQPFLAATAEVLEPGATPPGPPAPVPQRHRRHFAWAPPRRPSAPSRTPPSPELPAPVFTTSNSRGLLHPQRTLRPAPPQRRPRPCRTARRRHVLLGLERCANNQRCWLQSGTPADGQHVRHTARGERPQRLPINGCSRARLSTSLVQLKVADSWMPGDRLARRSDRAQRRRQTPPVPAAPTPPLAVTSGRHHLTPPQ